MWFAILVSFISLIISLLAILLAWLQYKRVDGIFKIIDIMNDTRQIEIDYDKNKKKLWSKR
jgi:hypothetical protein